MDIARLSAAALRRWYVVLPLLLLTAIGVVVVGDRVNPEYEANGSVLFFSPGDGQDVSNPYESPVQAATAISVIVSGGTVRSELAERGLSSDYEVETIESRPGSASPILGVTVRTDDEALSLSTRDEVVAEMSRQLLARQAEVGVPVAERTEIALLDAPADVSTVTTGPLRAQIVVLVLGVVFTFLLAVLVDDLLLRARRRRSRVSAEAVRQLTGEPGTPAHTPATHQSSTSGGASRPSSSGGVLAGGSRSGDHPQSV